jgi:hypothetical protein
MSKKVIHITRKLNTGDALLISKYTNINKTNAKKLINRLWAKFDKPLIVKSRTSVMIPSQGMEIIRTGYRSLMVCQLTGGGFNTDPDIPTLLKGGCTHFYNEQIDGWVSLQEALEDNEAYDKREAERKAFNETEDAKYHQDINTPEV